MQYVNDNLNFLQDALSDIGPILKALDSISTNESASSSKAVTELLSLCESAGLSFFETEIPSSLSQAREGVSRIREIVMAMKTFADPETITVTSVSVWLCKSS